MRICKINRRTRHDANAHARITSLAAPTRLFSFRFRLPHPTASPSTTFSPPALLFPPFPHTVPLDQHQPAENRRDGRPTLLLMRYTGTLHTCTAVQCASVAVFFVLFHTIAHSILYIVVLHAIELSYSFVLQILPSAT